MNSIPTTLPSKVATACAFAASWCFLATDSLALEMVEPEDSSTDNLALEMEELQGSYAHNVALEMEQLEGSYIDNLALEMEELQGSYIDNLALETEELRDSYTDSLALETEELRGSSTDSLALETEEPKDSYWLAASNKDLDEMRGGFDFGNGLMFSIGIERATYINGALITTTSFNFNNLDRLSPELAAQINKNVATLIQNGPGNTFHSGPPPATSTGAVARNTSSASAGAVQNASSNSPASAVRNTSATAPAVVQNTSSAAPAVVAQNTSAASPGTVVQNTQSGTSSVVVQTTPSFLPSTFIQNTLNDQHIRTLTMINATVNSVGMMRSLHSLSTLREALAGAIHSRW
jgi:hypothetical protein